MNDRSIFRQQPVDLLNGSDRGSQRAAVVIRIERIQQRAVLTDQRCFGRCRTGIDTEVAVAGVGGQITGTDLVLILTGTMPSGISRQLMTPLSKLSNARRVSD